MSQQYPLILSLETATRCSSAALTRGTLMDGEVLACLSFSSSITHSRRLIGIVDTLFRETETGWSDIEGVAVGLGPGSFTGLRIGMATAKGFAAAAQKKLLGVSTLDALASMCLTGGTVCAVLDARKKQVYTAFYDGGDDGSLIRRDKIQVLSPQQLVGKIDDPVVMVGDGVLTYGDFWKEQLGDRVKFAPYQLHAPSAAAVGLLCGGLLYENKYLDLATAAPVYVRASDAELSLADKKHSKDFRG